MIFTVYSCHPSSIDGRRIDDNRNVTSFVLANERKTGASLANCACEVARISIKSKKYVVSVPHNGGAAFLDSHTSTTMIIFLESNGGINS